MTKKNDPIEVTLSDPLQDAEAIRRCLEYLRIEARRTGLSFAAHLIAVAAEAVSDSIALTEKSVAQVERKEATAVSSSSNPGLTQRH